MPLPVTILVISLAWLAWAWAASRLMDNPRKDARWGILFAVGTAYVHLVHRLRVEGRQHIPGTTNPGALIVVVNHTAGIDPVLVQAACPFEIRWMMAKDMMLPGLDWVWKWLSVIGVDRQSPRGDPASAREALRHLQSGGVLGIFPEGAIERPPRRLLAFMPGIGLLVKKSRARVLPVIVDGTPESLAAWGSLWRFSHSRVRMLPIVSYEGTTLSAEAIAADLHRRYAECTGWSEPDAPAREGARQPAAPELAAKPQQPQPAARG
ncbi:MAG: lysophospholipid acyltransferase family protein [Planctomycetota bacterium]